jgi:hypothetical protein
MRNEVMTRKPLLHICELAAFLAIALPLFAQGRRFDIAIEGPWIFSQKNNLSMTFGSTTSIYSALIAIAPRVKGHYQMVFTSGAGLSITPGFYCVGFGSPCSPSQRTIQQVGNDLYFPQNLVQIDKGNRWNWASLITTNNYVLILPLPNSWSSDGTYGYDLINSLPSSQLPNPLPTKSYAIGVQLHYLANNPIKDFEISPCDGTSSTFVCPTAEQIQPNTGTLRIAIKSPEEYVQDSCDHHVHRAYHYMTSLIDLNASARNGNSAFLLDDSSNTDECLLCDPQQDKISSDCSAGPAMISQPSIEDVEVGLQDVILSLHTLLPRTRCPVEGSDNDGPAQLCLLETISSKIQAGAANLQTFSSLEAALDRSQTELGQIRTTDVKATREVTVSERARYQEKSLGPTIVNLMISSTSGKDCRAPLMLVQ